MPPRKKRHKLAVGDVFESESGRRVEITGIDVQALTISVDVERRIIDREGTISIERRQRVVPKEMWKTFIQSYLKAKS